MLCTIKYEQNNKTHAKHNQISTKQQNPCNTQANTNKAIKPCYTQSNINKTIKPMQYTTKYQRSDKTHATHNQNRREGIKPMQISANI